ncbi:hypothetical protein Egran_03484 [Elaphomyces granulatus]|uniref:Uncharacterized protein n=1 Tax=Elaphomyces granulatus TaxID=519963 RepID=A0A232LX79_9EURO|nr:hypothetical protein Egran_03484 [Elaphomyces granulatus]
MPSIPSSPVSPPRRHRRPASIDISSTSPQAYVNGFDQSTPRTPRTPGLSHPQSPVSPRQRNSQIMNGIRRMSTEYIEVGDSGGGLGSLADELADAWEEEGYEDMSGLENVLADHSHLDGDEGEHVFIESTHDMGMPLGDLSPANSALLLPRQKIKNAQNRHRRQESQYDGSDYGNDSDFDDLGYISPNLEARMAGIETLARRGLEENGSSGDQAIKRLIESLRDLGGQSGIENGATRLIAAHTSITSHLTHQTRALQTLIHPLLFSHFPLLSSEAIDTLIPLIDEGLLPSLAFPFAESQLSSPQTPISSSSTSSQSASLNPLLSLQTLFSQTSDLTHTLRGLSDSLHESRQLTSTASRKLRSARELVAELRREDEDREEGTRWIEKGEWDRRLREREAGKVCGEVVSGFEAVCGEWREKLFGPAAELAAA